MKPIVPYFNKETKETCTVFLSIFIGFYTALLLMGVLIDWDFAIVMIKIVTAMAGGIGVAFALIRFFKWRRIG